MSNSWPGPPDEGKVSIDNAHFPPEAEHVPHAAEPIPVEVRVVWKPASTSGHEEWIPAVAVRWTKTHVCIHVTDPRAYRPEFWVVPADVRRRD
jgi:hypothetical protein